MKLSALINPRLVRCSMAARTKDEALQELVKLLVASEAGLTDAEILAALAEREKQGPFSMGKGIAFPHARTEKVRDFTIVLGTSPAGIDFKAADGVKVRILILFVIPKKHSNLYLQTLAAFLNFFTVESNTQRVLEAKTGEDVVATIDGLSSRPAPAAPVATNGHVASIPSGTTLARALDALAAARAEALPVVDGEGNLVGELTAGSVLQLGVRDHLLSLATPATLSGVGSLEQALRQKADATIESLALVHSNGFPTVQEEETSLEVAIRLAGSGRTAYVLKGRRLVGTLGPAELLRRLLKAER
jgi:mannitol/fructose-specific phosphotransferase system IIA component (Ntr-type)